MHYSPITHVARISTVLLLIVVAFGSSVLFAQEDPDLRLPTPPEENTELAFMMGHWDVSGEAVLRDGSTADVEAFSSIESFMDGWAMREALIGVAGDTVIAASGLKGYDNRRGNWGLIWTDNQHESAAALNGTWQDDELLARRVGVGEQWVIRFKDMTEDGFSVEMDVAPSFSGDYAPAWRLTYTRRDTEPTSEAIDTLLEGAARPEPHEKMAQFGWWVGEWTMRQELLVGNNWVEKEAWDTLRWVADGFGLEEHWRGFSSSDSYYEFYTLSRYNAVSDSWDNALFGMGGIQFFVGSCDDEPENVCKLAGRFYNVYDGVEAFTWAIPNLENANWRMIFTRVTDEE